MPLHIAIESTPNPHARKFTVNRKLTDGRPRSYRSAQAAAGDALAGALFAIPKVVGVLIVNDFCTVNKAPSGRWKILVPRIEAVLRKQLEAEDQTDAATSKGE